MKIVVSEKALHHFMEVLYTDKYRKESTENVYLQTVDSNVSGH
jgi:hypothetical protein